MSGAFAKLNLKDQKQIVVLNAPASFEPELQALAGVEISRAAGAAKFAFCLAFVTRQKEVDALARRVARQAAGDAVVWFAYPKGTSKKYTCDFNRDTGWAALSAAGFRPVRQVAIDEDWSALRFRRSEFVASTRPAAKPAPAADFAQVHARLKAIMQQNTGPGLSPRPDAPSDYQLIGPVTGRSQGREVWFGAVQTRKNYVSYHLMPVYAFPDLLEDISPELKKRMQGKACFNFKAVDEKLFKELARLTTRGYRRFRKEKLILDPG